VLLADMTKQVDFLIRGMRTQRALEGFLARVNAEVSLQLPGGCERLATCQTFVRSRTLVIEEGEESRK
jgi:hypothetical protein